jgi:hypothetical protein
LAINLGGSRHCNSRFHSRLKVSRIQGGGVELLGMSIGSAQYTRCCGRNAIHNRQLYDRIWRLSSSYISVAVVRPGTPQGMKWM